MRESLPGLGNAKAVLLDRATQLTFTALPRIPERAKRVLLGGRPVVVDGNTLDATLQMLLLAHRVGRLGGVVADRRPNDGVAASRAQLRLQAARLSPPIRADVTEMSIPGPAGPMSSRLYVPDGSGATPKPALLLYFHGGGFVLGDLDTHDSLCRLICRDGGLQVLAVDYRLAPEHPAPAAVDDAYATYLWALQHVRGLGATRIVVGGDGAGGNLAAVVAQQARDDELPVPALQLLLYPVTDWSSQTRSRTMFADGHYLTQPDIDWFAGHYLGGADVAADDPVVSPLLAEELFGLPPALVYTAGFDPLRDEGNRYAQALRDAGVLVDLREERTLIHGFANFFPLGGGSATATTAMISALGAHLSHASGRPT